MDKLAMEEAGFKNCVSVPDGAPPKVSAKELPAEEKVFFSLLFLKMAFGCIFFFLIFYLLRN